MFKLTKHTFRALSDICTNFSAVFLASLVIPIFINPADISLGIVLSGIILMLAATVLSLFCAEKGKL